MDTQAIYDSKRKPFLWGMGLTFTFSAAVMIPAIIGIAHVFRGISEQKAIGLGAVAAGMSEVYWELGVAFTLVAPIVAIVLLVRSLSGGHVFRSLISWLSIGWCALMLLYFSLGAWAFLTQVWQR